MIPPSPITPAPVPWFSILTGGKTLCDATWSRPLGIYADFYRFYAPVKGRAVIHLGGKSHWLEPGRLYFIPGYRRVGYACKDHFDVLWLHFRADILELEALLGELAVVRAWPGEMKTRWWSVIQRIPELITRPAPSLAHAAQAMLLDLSVNLVSDRLDQQTSDQSALTLARFRPALLLMDQHYLANPSLARIAAVTGLSPTYFHAQFVRRFHVTPHHYMLRLRMRQARQLLGEGELSVNEVALQCGYPNVFYFSRTVKRFFSQTPRQLRGQSPSP